MSRSLVVAIFAPKFGGKNVQFSSLADYLAKFGIELSVLESGKWLREQQRLGTEVGSGAGSVMKTGALVGDDVIVNFLTAHTHVFNTTGIVGLNGVIRSVPQAHHFVSMCPGMGIRKLLCFELVVPQAECLKRLAELPQENDRGERADDTQEALVQSLAEYDTNMRGIRAKLRQVPKSLLDVCYYEIDGVGDAKAIHLDIVERLLLHADLEHAQAVAS